MRLLALIQAVKVSDMLSTLIELQRLKRLDRTGWTLRGMPNGTESVAAHSFGVAVTAMMLADEVAKCDIEIDCERVLRLALIHDWAETRVGDMPRTATTYFGADVRKRAEEAAFLDIVGANAAAYKNLYDDYEQRASIEARLVKAADVIDLLLQAYALEKAGARGLDEFWDVIQTADFGLPAAAADVVNQVFDSLLDARRTIHGTQQ